MKCLLITLFFGATIVVNAQETQKPRADPVLPATAENLRKIDSLLGQIPTASPSQRFDIRYELFGRYLTVSLEKAAIILDSCVMQSSKTNDSLWVVKTTNASGYLLSSRGDLDGAIKQFQIALAIAQRNNYDDQVRFLLNILAISYTSRAYFDKALFYNLESLRIREVDGNPRDISIALNNTGLVYEELGDLENALAYYKRSYNLKIEKKINYDLELLMVNIGGILNQTNKFTESEKMVNQALDLCKSGKCRPAVIAQAQLVLGISMMNQKKFVLGEEYLIKSLVVHRNLESLDGISLSLYWLSKLFYLRNQPILALHHLDESQKFADKSGLQNRIMNNYFLYSEIYSELGNYKKAFDFQRQYNILNARILSGNLISRISAVQLEHEQRENNAKIRSQAEVMQLQKDSIEQHQLLNVSFGFAAMLLGSIVWILVKSNRQKQHLNEILDNRVKERTFELEKNRDELQHAHDEQRLVLRKVSGDLVSSLATFRGLSYAAERDLPIEKAIYFKEAEATAERVVGYVKQFSLNDDIGEFNKDVTRHLE